MFFFRYDLRWLLAQIGTPKRVQSCVHSVFLQPYWAASENPHAMKYSSRPLGYESMLTKVQRQT